MLKKITVQDRQEMLLAELRKRGNESPVGNVPLKKKHIGEMPLCALGLVCKLWPEQIDWSRQPDSQDALPHAQAAKLIGAKSVNDAIEIMNLNDYSRSRAEVADKLEKLFATFFYLAK